MCEKIEILLKDKIGLDISSVGTVSVQNAIKRCLVSSGCDDLEQYYKRLLSSKAEFERLVEMVIIPETWFFRDDIPFDVFANHVKSDWLMPKENSRMLKVLSVPCSTGEEPYTIAMVLDNLDFPADRFQIDAIDISQASLDKAVAGVYRDNSFRSEDLTFQSEFFQKIEGHYCLKEKIRRRVNFHHGNLLKDDFSLMKGCYDVIFCRNLLIYFDSKDQKIAVHKLSDLLAPDGVLFVGHAEANNNVNSLFKSLRLRGAFAFVKKDGDESHPVGNYGKRFHEFSKKHSATLPVSSQRTSADQVSKNSDRNKPFSAYMNSAGYEAEKDEQALLSKAQELADEGALEEAEELCLDLISRFSNADAYYLLGLVYEASSRQDMAESMFRKTIYLVPDHARALVHLALHVERNGNSNEAQSLRRRAVRAAQ
ncbi:Chemotaxis protein methyltransferase CheR [hydrothermal vent metagenome]|uniref:Chemotaxis protein methyltransferase CheR n=1 Tax=hydrothermal vent metagenome TaxID=652676 RepID=A0A3B0ZJR5_9ZZZZ